MGKSDKTSKKLHIVALVMAAGSGLRVGEKTPKQYLCIAGKTILRRTIEVFANHPLIDDVCVVTLPEHKKLYEESVSGLDILKPAKGDKKSRQKSVRNGLETLQSINPDIVLIHDAARPFVSNLIIENVINSLKKSKAVIPVMPVKDTLKRIKNSKVEETVDRDSLFLVQTPQGFDYQTILQAHIKAKKDCFADDAGLAEEQGINVATVEGSACNFKITTKEDLAMFEKMIGSNREVKVGMGFDAHAFGVVKGRGHHIMLCGIPVVHKNELSGHSDGDVGLHAIADAMLGALGEEDIGAHFPSSDPKWKNADSATFIKHALSLIKERDGIISHIDITLVAEMPKISPHRDAMKDRIAELLNISINNVSVKATTTDKLGFLGRGEGIAAQAIATVQLLKKE